MHVVLIGGGYPPVALRPEDRPAYSHALQQAQVGEANEAFSQRLYQRLDATLEEFLSALRDAASPPAGRDGRDGIA